VSQRDNHRASAAPAGVTTDAPEVTAQQRRLPSYLKAKLSRDARAAAGFASPVQLAMRLGVSVSVVKQHESRAYDREPRLSMMLAVREYGLHMAGAIAAEHGAYVAPLPAVVEMPDAQRHARIQCEAADVVRVVAVHAADGRHELDELLIEERELQELLVETQNRLAWVRAKLKGGAAR
jgi:hypothetical protein